MKHVIETQKRTGFVYVCVTYPFKGPNTDREHTQPQMSLSLQILSQTSEYDQAPKVIKLFSCSTQLSVKFQLLIKT